MEISGNEENLLRLLKESDFPAEHLHCLNCFKWECDYDGSKCEQVLCPFCKTRLHGCKLEDHQLCCSQVSIVFLTIYSTFLTFLRLNDNEDFTYLFSTIILYFWEANFFFELMETANNALHYVEINKNKIAVPCPNAYYGCERQMKRCFVAGHLPKCPASVVHCAFVRNRRFVSELAKKKIKLVAKEISPKIAVTNIAEIDEKLAEKDQV
jgi:hypothetical protein